MNKSDNMYHVFFRNLANPLRTEIVSILKNKEMSVNEIAKNIKVEQSKLSHALASLKKCRIVESKQEGKQRIYYLNKKTVVPLLKLIDKHSKDFCKNSGCKGCDCGC